MNHTTFKNEPVTDFAIASERAHYEKALQSLHAQIAKTPLVAKPVIDGKTLSGGETATRYNPSNTSQIVGVTHFASVADTEHAITSLAKGFLLWRDTPVSERSAILHRAADEMHRRKAELAALIIIEAGKPWREADGDVGEAIDFCRYYAAVMDEMSVPFKTQNVPGEENHYFYEPRGVAAVIAPWNFPLAIACGMTVAALVTGNTAILKPAEQTSLIAYELVQILYRAGVPTHALAFLPGRGEEVGRTLVNDPRVPLIVFTGSRAVGLEILSACGKVAPGQHHFKKPILELGGKNCIIVDEDGDFDEAIKGVLQSTFGFAGQKCSACARLIVVGEGYHHFMERLTQAAGDLIVGDATEPSTFCGPVIDEESHARISAAIQKGESSAKVAFKGTVPAGGYFVPLTIFSDVATDSSLWLHEIFGPVLAARKATTFAEAVELANGSEYALTGGVYSRSPKSIEYAKRHFRTGNLYINRTCTGSLVGRQPFGGFKMSGLGSKAGGPDYLLHFLDPRTITENTMRRGFTPETK